MKKLMLLVGAMSASMVWAENVSYRYYDTAEKTFKTASANCTVVTSATREFANGGWYAVTKDVTITDAHITVNGSAHLILCDGKTLTVTNVPDWCAAIDVSVVGSVTNSLSIYGQECGTGGLNAFGGYAGAGIGGYYDSAAEEIFDGGTVRIDGGTVTAMGGTPLWMSEDGFAGICGGMVMINGGTVTAIGTDGSAGIGRYAGGDGGTVEINGGVVTATGGYHGAGIGGGQEGDGGTVMISGGTVTASGGESGAGIGGGDGRIGGTVTINDGIVTAQGGYDAAGIGGGWSGAGGTVTINGGTVTAQGGYDAAGIGGGYGGDGGTVTINGGAVTAIGGGCGAGIGIGDAGSETGSIEIADSVNSILAGDSMANAVRMTAEEYKADHDAKFVAMSVALVRIPQINGLSCVVSNGTEEATRYYSDGTNTYMAALHDTLNVYFTLKPGCTYTTGSVSNPKEVSVSDWIVTVDAEDLPSVSIPTIRFSDWDGREPFERTVTDYTFVTAETDRFSDGGWYAVAENVTIADHNITVNGSAHLILCDGATLTVTNVPDGCAAIDVSVAVLEDESVVTNSLSIYGQTGGTGGLNAFGGYVGAGIGGGGSGAGGTVTINGGAVTAIGGECGAGIGGGWSGAGGTVTINGGTVTASGGESGAGIGGGAYSEDAGMVTFGVSFEGGVLAGADVTHASVLTTDEFVQDHSAAYVTMPVAALRIPQIAGVTYVVSNGTDEIEGVRMNGTNTYRVAIGDSLKLYFVRDPDCTYVQEPKANPKILGEVTGVMTIGLEDLPTVRVPPIAYLDWDDGKLVEKATTDYLEYRGDVALAGGVTYVVRKDMSVGFRFRVNGTVDNPTRLILCDGATLSATQGVEVSVDEDNAITHALIICGQTQGSGTLIATGSEDSAGIGGGINGAGGAVTINGGTVFACADTESGDDDGAGIGGGIFGAGGSVTINGGTVTATGGENGAGIGGGYNRAGGTVMITGGKVAACGGKSGEDIGHGQGSEDSGTVMVSGGLFWEGLKDEWIAKGYRKFANDDTKTKDQYPWMVLHRVKITLPTDVPECSYVVSNLTTGAEIKPSGGQEGGADYLLPVGDHVAIFCVPSEGYMVIGTNPHDIPEVTAETTVVVENLPTVLPARTAEFFLGEGIASVTFTTEPAVTSGVATVDFTLSPIPQGTKINIEVICADGYDEYVGTNEFVVGEEDICVALETSLPAVEYCDAQGRRLEAEHVVVLNARAGGVLGDGKWYLITGTNEVNRTLSVRGEVNLILMDGAKLTVVGEEQQAGVAVTGGNSLTIWGQSLGTGELVARGGYEGAGIGGGLYGSGGTVTINGGIITAQGNSFSAGIGGGDWGSGGTVTINGGQVTAKGGWWGAGIGGGLFGAGKEVLITGGKVIALGNDGGEDIGHGCEAEGSGTIVISGGVFGMTIPSGWCAPNYFAVENTNPETRGSYPWAVASMSVVTVGNHPHTTAAYTYGDGSKTNVIGEDSFEIPLGTFGVQVIFTLEHHYRFVDVHETGIRALDSPLTKDAYEVVPPEVEGIPGTVVNPWSVGETVTAYVSDEGVLIIGGTGEMDDFASEDEAPWAAVVGAIKEVTVAAGVTKVGKNALAKVGDAIKVDGTPLSTYRTVTDHTTTINGISLDEYNAAVRRLNVGEEWKAGPASELVVPDGMVLVTKESIQAAQAMTVEIVDGQVELGVSVLSNADFTVSTADWAPVKFSSDTKIDFSADGTKIILSIPVSAPQGFMILQSGDAKIGQ